MNKFREYKHTPTRTYTKKHRNYRDYKPFLEKDFKGRCGYTNCSQFWFGGRNNFHIDHFIPWKKNSTNPELKTDYNNLVYCCSYVNILKSDNEGPFLDPCNVDYNDHFGRNSDGGIYPKTEQARFMYNTLKLYFPRYKIIWQLDRMKEKMTELENLKSIKTSNVKLKKINKLLEELRTMFTKYTDYLECVQ